MHGRIRRILLTCPHDSGGEFRALLRAYRGLFRALDTDVAYVVLAPGRLHAALRAAAAREGLGPESLTLVTTDGQPTPSIWARDVACVLSDASGVSTLLVPRSIERAGDHLVAECVAAALGMRLRRSEFALEGGNVLAGAGFALVGRDVLSSHSAHGRATRAALVERLQAELGVPHVLAIGSDGPIEFPVAAFQGKRQPIFHIDAYLTLGGTTAQGRELVFVGDVRLAKRVLGEPAPGPQVSGPFDAVAGWLAAYAGPGPRFEVRRLPLDLSIAHDGSGHGAFLTYNNSLVEVTPSSQRVYFPSYVDEQAEDAGPSRLNAVAAEAFAAAGFEPVAVRGPFTRLCWHGGSLRCITNVLER
ncbi:MAG: hypothetical protein GY711_06070 [bacterium]|nr:hypothetical protein [bacterium]